jgi:hypothetical protein
MDLEIFATASGSLKERKPYVLRWSVHRLLVTSHKIEGSNLDKTIRFISIYPILPAAIQI